MHVPSASVIAWRTPGVAIAQIMCSEASPLGTGVKEMDGSCERTLVYIKIVSMLASAPALRNNND